MLIIFGCSQQDNTETNDTNNSNQKSIKDLTIPQTSSFIPLNEVVYVRNGSFDDNYYCLKTDSSRLNGTTFYYSNMKTHSYFYFPFGWDGVKDSICIMEFKNGKADGFMRIWHKNKKLKYSGYFKKGYQVNKHLSFSISGDTIYEGNFELINLPRKLMKDTILFSAKQGIFKVRWPDSTSSQPPIATYGGLNESKFYKNDSLHGLQKTWFYNGQLQLECNYKNGKKDGQFKRWYDNGQIRELFKYKNGKFNGEQLAWHENGNKEGQSYFIESKRDSLQYEWYENGILKRQSNYQLNQLIEESCFDEKGDEIKCSNGWN
jgi:antitoxin component YwqK of YwqJK toxin-antitoxin module